MNKRFGLLAAVALTAMAETFSLVLAATIPPTPGPCFNVKLPCNKLATTARPVHPARPRAR